jgi:hypothetical protein
MNHCAIVRCFKHLWRFAQWNQGCTAKRKSGLWRNRIAVAETRHVRWEGPGYLRPSFVRLGNGVASMGSEPHERHKKSTPSPVPFQFLKSSFCLSTRIFAVRSPFAAPREIRVRNTDLGFRVWPASRMLFRAQDLDSLWLTTKILYPNSLAFTEESAGFAVKGKTRFFSGILPSEDLESPKFWHGSERRVAYLPTGRRATEIRMGSPWGSPRYCKKKSA